MPGPPPVRGLLQGCRDSFRAIHYLGVPKPNTTPPMPIPTPRPWSERFNSPFLQESLQELDTESSTDSGTQESLPIPTLETAITLFHGALAQAIFETELEPGAAENILRATANKLNTISRQVSQGKGKITAFYTEEYLIPRPQLRTRRPRGHMPPLQHSPDSKFRAPTQPTPPGNFPTPQPVVTHNLETNHPGITLFKLKFLPNVATPEDVLRAITQLNPHLAMGLTAPFKLIPHPRHKMCSTALIKVHDVVGFKVKVFTDQPVAILGEQRRLRIWLDKPNTPQCSQCYKWGHHFHTCRMRGSYCAICVEPHPTLSHPTHCKSSHTHGPNSPPCPNTWCINCGKPREYHGFANPCGFKLRV